MEGTYEVINIEGLTLQIEKFDDSNEGRRKRMAAICIGIRNVTGKNRKDFAEWLGIPYRTMTDWERTVRVAPEYLIRLIAYKVRMEDAKE